MSYELAVPETFDAHTLVEYVESLMLVEDISHLSMTELSNRFPAGQRPSAADIGLIRSEIRRRRGILGDAYPYRADSEGVARVASQSAVYDFVLVISLEAAPYRVEQRFNEINRLFDFLIREALQAHLGPGSEAVRFGTPVQDGRPEDFIVAVTWLATRMGVAEGVMDRPPDDNDAGVDVVGWKHFADHRTGFPVILVQGTTRLDYEEKVGRIPTNSWKRWLDLGPEPGTGLAIPFMVQVGDDRWMKVTTETGILFDRLRICDLLRTRDLSHFGEWTELATVTAAERTRLAIVETKSTASKKVRVAKPRRQKDSVHRTNQRR